MKMEYTMSAQSSQKIRDRVSTQEIKAGLERIKRAQEQVLEQLKKNHPDYSIDVRKTNSQIYYQQQTQNQLLRKELKGEREKSVEKSTLYRKRVVDLQSSLETHSQNQIKLKIDNKLKQDQINKLKNNYNQIDNNYQQLLIQNQKLNKNAKYLQSKILQLNQKLQNQDKKKLQKQYQNLVAEKNLIILEQQKLITNNKTLQQQNLLLKSKIQGNNEKQNEGVKQQYLSKILVQVNKSNSSHQFIFSALKSSKKLSKEQIQKQNKYQNSLNQILQMLGVMQKVQIPVDGGIYYKFDHEQSFEDEVKKIETQLNKKYKKQVIKFTSQKEELVNKNRVKDRLLVQIQNKNRQLQQKLDSASKQKSQYLQQITQLTQQVSALKMSRESAQRQRTDQQIKKQRNKDDEYRMMILQLNEQMITIQRQKKDLDGLLNAMSNKRQEDQVKNKKKIIDVVEINKQMRIESDKVKQKYQLILIEKQHLYLDLTSCQTKNSNLGKELARQMVIKQKLIAENNKLKQQIQLNMGQIKKYKLISQNTERELERITNSYIKEIERIMQENALLREQIASLMRDRNELREVKSNYGLLLKDNQILGKKVKYSNSQIDHLWAIKEVEYQNVNRVLLQLKPQ